MNWATRALLLLGVAGAALTWASFAAAAVASAGALVVLNLAAPAAIKERLFPLTLVVVGGAVVIAIRDWVVPAMG